MAGRLDNKVVLISGAAHGIGRAVAMRMAIEGAHLWLCDILDDELAATAAAASELGNAATGMAGDATDTAFVTRWVTSAIERYRRIDVLYNNVGVSRPGLIGELSDDDWHFQQRLTLDSVFYATRAVLPQMVSQRAGSIISMSSGAGIGGQYNLLSLIHI